MENRANRKKEITPEVVSAAATFKNMYDYCLNHELHRRVVDAANMVAIVGSEDERIEWGYKGIQAAEQGQLEEWLGPLWNNHGWNLDDMGEYDKALEALKKAREYHYRNDNDLPKLIADWSVGQAYRKTGQIDSALAWMTRVYRWANERYENDPSTDNVELIGFAGKELGEIALVNGDSNKALDYFDRAKKNLADAGMQRWDEKSFKDFADRIEDLKQKMKQQ